MQPAAVLPSRCCRRKRTLSGAYFELRTRIDQIVAQAEQQGSLAVAVSGLNSLRQTLDSLARLAGHTAGAQVNVAVQTNVNVDLTQIADRLIKRFDHEPELKARIAQALVEIDDEPICVRSLIGSIRCCGCVKCWISCRTGGKRNFYDRREERRSAS